MARFLVIGRLGLALKGDDPIEVGDVTIGTAPPSPHPFLDAPLISVSSTFEADVVFAPPVVTIRTNAYIWCYVTTDSAAGAVERARGLQLVALRHALSRRLGRVVEASFVYAVPADGSAPGKAIGPQVGAMPLKPQALADTEEMEADYLAVVDDERCTTACTHLERARTLARAGQYLGPPARDAAVLEYAKALEYLAGDRRLSQPVTDLAKQQDVEVTDLTKRLAKATTAKQRAKAVMSSSDNLKRLDRRFTDQRITAMADLLDLPTAWLTGARRLFSARNKKIAHPGQYLTIEEHRLLLYGEATGSGVWSASTDWVVSEAISASARHFAEAAGT